MKKQKPTIGIVGSGLAGLLTALNIIETLPSVEITILEKSQPQSNTQIAGMRFRQKKSGSSASYEEEYVRDVIELMVAQNQGVATEEMRQFAQHGYTELQRWDEQLKALNPLLSVQEPSWFGPQWGLVNQSGKGGRGSSVLKVLRELATAKGIRFIATEVQQLLREGPSVRGVTCIETGRRRPLFFDQLVLANGSVGGSLYESTNKDIAYSAGELLHASGYALEGGTLNMWHPFGRSATNGEVRVGCYETDTLAGWKVFLGSGVYDEETTQLLAEHRAHYHFAEICRRFLEHGNQVTLLSPEGETKAARVSLHYSHLGAETVDGSLVKESDNLYVVGDAGGYLHWSNHRARLPGFALTNCLVSARVCANNLAQKIEGNAIKYEKTTHAMSAESDAQASRDVVTSRLLRKLNTEAVMALEFKVEDAPKILSAWEEDVSEINDGSTLADLSMSLPKVWTRRLAGEAEPLVIEGRSEKRSMQEGLTELRPKGRRL